MPTSLIFSAIVARRLREQIRRINPAIVLAQDGLHTPVPTAWALRGTQTKLAVMDHGTLTNTMDREWRKIQGRRLPWVQRLVRGALFTLDGPWRAWRWRRGIQSADELWSAGPELDPFFSRAGDRARRYMQVVPPSFAPPSQSERSAARRALGITDGYKLVNVVSRIDGEKGFDSIIAAAGAVSQIRRDFVLFIAGDGTLKDWVEAESARLGLTGQVRLLGWLNPEQVRTLQHASDFHIYAGTISCGLSICLLEAMACGVVPIASDVPRAQRELVQDAGWIFPAGDTGALTKALNEALSISSSRYWKMRQASRDNLFAAPYPALSDLIDRLIHA